MLFIFFSVFAFPGFSQDHNVVIDTVDNYNSWGWKALVVDNGFIQLVILPEIGGRVLHYGFDGDTYMAVNSAQITKTYNPATNQTGPWTSWGYGGYKAWPSPQSVWTPSTWPPPPYLDWGSYTWSVEHASADSVVIYLISPLESYKTPGLQQARRFKIFKNTTRVIVEQIIKNVSSPRNEWSVWEVTQAIVDHDGTHDYANVSTYFPSAESDIEVLMGNKIPTTEVAENVRKWNYAGNGWKLGALLKEGWVCFVDERDEQAYAKVFDIDPVHATYPDKNSNFMLYVGGTYVEIEVQGPLTEILQGDSIAYTETWYAAGIKGDILTANHGGAVRKRLSFNASSSAVQGEFGIFNSGSVQLKYFSISGQETEAEEPVAVSASDKFILDATLSLPGETDMIKLVAYDSEGRLICTLDSCLVSDISGFTDKSKALSCHIYPTLMSRGSGFNISLSPVSPEAIQVAILSLADGRRAGEYLLSGTATGHRVSPVLPMPGLYLVTVQHGQRIWREKIAVF